MKNDTYILGIETSCDDTSVAILKNKEVIAHLSYGQEETLKHWGGVVPEIAARNHLNKITPTLKESFQSAGITPEEIDYISVTAYPGLLGPLLTGINAAKTLSLIYKKPIIPVNHLYAHILAIQLTQEVSYPFLGLLISGGHSLFLWVKNENDFEVISGTIDDACGEAFDKGGKLLELGYPAGHIIDKLSKFGDPNRFEFPIGLKSSADARLSFSGTKTALRVFLEKNPEILSQKPKQFSQKEASSQDFYDVCASYQRGITKALLLKTRYAFKHIQQKYQANNQTTLVIGGGVAANSDIREEFMKTYPQTLFVAREFCTDNAAMIANWGRLNINEAIHFPYCLEIDAKSRFINKKKM